MRLSPVIGALAAFAFGSAQAATTPQKAVGGVPTYTPVGLQAGTPSAFFGETNNFFQATTAMSNYLVTPTGSFYVPTKAASSYAACTALAANKTCSWSLVIKFMLPNNAAPAQTFPTYYFSLAGNCAGTCASGTDKALWITGLNAGGTQARNDEFSVYGGVSGTNLWIPPGGLTVPQTGLNPLQGHNYCAVLSQYGDDATGAAGIMSLAIDDNTGTPLSGSPVVTSTVNNSAAATGFYYSAANTIRTQASIGDIIRNIGITSTATTSPRGTPGPISDIAMLWGVFPNSSGTPTAQYIADLCNGTHTFSAWLTEIGGQTLNSHYALNPDAGVTLADGAGNITTALTNSSAGTIVSASPTTPSNAILMNEVGQADVMRVEPGLTGNSATGTVYISGTYNTTTLGVAPSAIQAEILQSGSVIKAWSTIANHPSAGKFTGTVGGVLVNYSGNTAPYTVCLRAQNAPSFTYCSKEQIYIGMVVAEIGQSERSLLASTGNAASSNSVQIPTGDIIIGSLGMNQLADPGGSYVNNCVSGYWGCPNGPHFGVRQAITSASGPTNQPGTGTIPNNQSTTCTGSCLYEFIGDGEATLAVNLATLSGWPVKVIMLAHTGTPVDAWIAGYQPVTNTAVTDTSNTLSYTATMANLVSPVNGLTGNYSSSTGTGTWSGVWYSIKKGTLHVYDQTAAEIANDPSGTGNFQTVAGAPGGITVTGGTITYSPSASSATAPSFASLTFNTNPNCPCTTSYTTIEDVNQSAYVRQTVTDGNIYTGIDLWGNGTDPTTGIITAIGATMSGPPSVWRIEQANANLSTGLAPNPLPASNAAASVCPTASTCYFNIFQNEWEYVINTKFGAYWWWRANTPLVVGGYERDTGNPYVQWAGGVQFFLNWGHSATNGGLTNPHFYGGSADDDTLQGLTEGTGGPHGDSSPFGALRLGRRGAGAVWAAQQGNQSPEPTVSTVAFTTDTTYNASCSTTGKCIRITFAIASGSSATKLETCGTGLLGTGTGLATAPANGTCVFTDYTSTPTIHGFSFGQTTSGTFWDDYGNDESSVSTTLTNSDGNGGTCKLQAALIVECVLTTVLSPGSTYLKYNNPWNRNGSVKSITVVAGAGTNGGPISVTGTGGTCTTHSQATLSVVATALVATRLRRGLCSVVESAYSTSGLTTTGTATPVLATPGDDITDIGSRLYDNAGGFGTSGAAGGSEPGWPVTSVNVPIGPF